MRLVSRDNPELVVRVLPEVAQHPGTARQVEQALSDQHSASAQAGAHWGGIGWKSNQ